MKDQIQEILEGQREVPVGEEITTKDELENMSEDDYESSDTREAFTTTRSGSALFPVEFIGSNVGKAFLMTGIGNESSDNILNGGAGDGHYSGMAVRLSRDHIPGNVLNGDKDQIGVLAAQEEDIIGSATSIASIPVGGIRIGEALGDKINPDKGFFAGDKIKDTTRDHLRRVTGTNEIYEAYGTSEMGIMATEVEGISHPSRVLMPLMDQYSFEIFPLEEAIDEFEEDELNPGESLSEGPDSTDELMDIREVENGTVIGRIYPSREGLPRYDQKDAVEVYSGQELGEEWPDAIPGIKILGRLDGLVAGGVTLTDSNMDKVIEDVSPTAEVPEYYVEKNGTTTEPNVLIESTLDVTRQELEMAFERHLPEMNYADDEDYLDWHYNQTETPGYKRSENAKIVRFADNTID